jgi:hypothetical protein
MMECLNDAGILVHEALSVVIVRGLVERVDPRSFDPIKVLWDTRLTH